MANEFKNKNGQTNNTVRSGRQQENRQEGRGEGRGNQQNSQQTQQAKPWKNDSYKKEGQGYRSYNRENRETRDNGFRPFNSQVSSRRIKTEETIDDIRADLARIEKEIDLEIKQIASMRLGL